MARKRKKSSKRKRRPVIPTTTRLAQKRAKGVDHNLRINALTWPDDLAAYEASAHDFWLLHGANFLASDYDNGTWAVLFDLYGKGAVVPSWDSAFDQIAAKYYDDEIENWRGLGQVLGAWLVQKPSGAILYYMSALRQIREAYPDRDPEVEIRKPYHPTVWEMFHRIKMQTMAGQPLAPEPQEETDDDGDSGDVEPRGDEGGEEVQQEGDGDVVPSQGPPEPVV